MFSECGERVSDKLRHADLMIVILHTFSRQFHSEKRVEEMF